MNLRRVITGLVLLDFSGFTAYAVYPYGLIGVFEQALANTATTLLFTDLSIALSLVMLWMWQDARERGVSVIPYVLLTFGLGSVGPLLYLFRREASERPTVATAPALRGAPVVTGAAMRAVLVIGLLAFVMAGGPVGAAPDPALKCFGAKQKAAGKKIAAKIGCWSKAKSKSNPVDAACLMKAEAGFTAAFAKAGGACGGDAGSIEMQVDQCVTAFLAEIPGDSKCTSSSAKVLGKAASGELGCTSKEIAKPGGEAACRQKVAQKTAGSLAKAGGCAAGGTADDIATCVNGIANTLQKDCCRPERTVLVSTPGTLKVGGFAPFPFPAGVIDIIDAGVADATCKHDVTLPPGGFVVPAFCIPALQYTSQVVATACESGTGLGAGMLWDGHAVDHGGVPMTNVTKNADSSDGTCDPGGGLCANADLNFLGNVDEIIGIGGNPAKVAVQFDAPAHSRTWQDSLGCPGDGVYNGAVDTLITEFDFILSPTSGLATGAFVDDNAPFPNDGCALPTGSAGFGAPSAECAAGFTGPCTTSGVQADGPCCMVGQLATLTTVGEAFSNSFPLYDLGFINVIPSSVQSCGPVHLDTCVVSTDACKF